MHARSVRHRKKPGCADGLPKQWAAQCFLMESILSFAARLRSQLHRLELVSFRGTSRVTDGKKGAILATDQAYAEAMRDAERFALLDSALHIGYEPSATAHGPPHATFACSHHLMPCSHHLIPRRRDSVLLVADPGLRQGRIEMRRFLFGPACVQSKSTTQVRRPARTPQAQQVPGPESASERGCAPTTATLREGPCRECRRQTVHVNAQVRYRGRCT